MRRGGEAATYRRDLAPRPFKYNQKSRIVEMAGAAAANGRTGVRVGAARELAI